jgi:hypothetical protein
MGPEMFLGKTFTVFASAITNERLKPTGIYTIVMKTMEIL